jgi:hypothetical protein
MKTDPRLSPIFLPITVNRPHGRRCIKVATSVSLALRLTVCHAKSMIATFFFPHSAAVKLVLILGVAAYVSAAHVHATTVVATLQDCPLCRKQFVRSSIASWFQGREPDRDFGGSMQAAGTRVIMCPHCLFSAIPSEFRFTDAGESNAVGKALAELRQRMRPLPQAVRTKALQNADYYGVELLQYRIAEVCDAARPPDAVRKASLHHSAYLWLKYADDPAVVAEERQQAIRAFEAAAQPAKPRRPKDLFWTYLAGELRRCAGDTNGAIALLDDAVRLAGAPGTQFEPGSLGRWAIEQADKARRGDTNDSPRMRMHGPEWDEQRRTIQRRLPEMVVALNSGQPPKQWLLEGEARLNTGVGGERIGRGRESECFGIPLRMACPARGGGSPVARLPGAALRSYRCPAQQGNQRQGCSWDEISTRFTS